MHLTDNIYKTYFAARNPYSNSGFMLMDIIIGSSLMLIVIISLIGVFRLGLEIIGESKTRVGALSLANEQVELARSLSYGNVGVAGGNPNGSLPSSEEVSLNGISYTRNTAITYYDDPKDGLGASDANGITNDYKKMRVDVSWTLRGMSRSLFITTNIVPIGIEN